ncbi:MAG: ribbon-helix-helix protein, CopG family [bacterium]|nr:ribbon-helix-helix domain-containing protein [bacterium]MBU1917366.1 ribbon-helix-helix domain-containing protein [bacterium]
MIFSFKLNPTLFEKLQKCAQESGESKGTLIRNALEDYLEKNKDFKTRIKNLTNKLIKPNQNKKPNWDSIHKYTRIETDETPEEEVLRTRRRGL